MYAIGLGTYEKALRLYTHRLVYNITINDH